MILLGIYNSYSQKYINNFKHIKEYFINVQYKIIICFYLVVFVIII